jgi:iron-sulfur cluster assembly protein
MLKLTEAALKQVQVAAQQGGAEGLALRLAAKRQADGSISYLIGFDEPGRDDFKIEKEGVTVIMEPEYVNLLDGAVMDYVEMEPGDFRFIFLNPNDETYIPPSDGAVEGNA